MNVYDFDGTIYEGDSSLDFYKYCVKKHPQILFCLPKQIWGMFLYYLRIKNKTKFKEHFFSFLERIDNIDYEVREFWDLHENRIKSWYVAQQRSDDLVISASPEFLLKEICDRKSIYRLIASDVDKRNGHFKSLNCYGKEKQRRLEHSNFEEPIENFYSDSLSDAPLAEIAKSAFIVQGDKLFAWERSK